MPGKYARAEAAANSLIRELEDKQAELEAAQEAARELAKLQEKPKHRGLDEQIKGAEAKRGNRGGYGWPGLERSSDEER